LSRLLLLLGLVLVLLAAGLGVLYWQLPALAARFGPEFARAYGVELEALEVERPGWRRLQVRRVAGRSNAVRFEARGLSLRYRPSDLLSAGALEAVDAASLELRVLAADRAPAPPATGDGPAAGLEPAVFFALVPAERVAIDALRVEVPAVGFAGRGRALLSGEQATVELVGEAPEQAAGLEFRGRLGADGAFGLVLRAGEGEGPMPLAVEGQLRGDRAELSGALELEGYPLRLAAAVLGAPAGEGRLAARFRTVEAVALERPEVDALALEGSFEADWRSVELPLALEDAAGDWSLRDGRVQTRFSSGAVQYGDDDFRIDAVMPAGLELSFADERLSYGPGLRVALRAEDLDASARLATGTVVLGEPLRVAGGADVTAETSGYRTEGSLTAEAALDGDRVTMTGTAAAAGLAFPLRATHDLASGRGQLESTAAFVVRRPLAAALVSNWAEDYDLEAGRLDVAVAFRWRPEAAATGRVEAALAEGLLRYGEDRIEGVAGTFDLRLEDGEVALLPAQVRAERANVGVLLEALEATVALSGDAVAVSGAKAELLGGRAGAEAFRYDLDTGSAAFTVTLDGLSLAALLALVGDDIRGEGSLGGTLPVTLADGVPSIRGGKLAAEPPGGVIQVAPDFAALTGQPGLDFALAALTDFRFETLESTVDYTEDGELTLGVRLEGKNPEVEKGRPIHYNLNITQNVLVLLESLRAQRAVTERLEKRVVR